MHSSKQRHNENRGPPVQNKVFVGGLAQCTTQESLKTHFQQFGNVEAIVMTDRSTGRSRGFGFCTFETSEAAEQALASPQTIDNKSVECCLCWAKSTTRLAVHKIFVGGLAQTTTGESLKAHFSEYGECEVMIMMDKTTGRSRGFGFCTFVEHDSLLAVLSKPQIIDGKAAECKVCSPKGEVPASCNPNRVFVGGIPQSADDGKLREFFSKYGTITEVRIMADKDSSRSRGFGYVTFESPQSCELALANRANNTIDGKWVEVKRCTEKLSIGKDGATQALAQLTPHQLTQVAHLTTQLQNILGQPLIQALQSQIVVNSAATHHGKSGKGKGKSDQGARDTAANASKVASTHDGNASTKSI
mmetsp:Transcript_37055/g.57420  ORF Transcript_37055/g.57420 Transcript_37055/m.57420 type:complete len:360 (+) Transcript_37055:47-1126(+)